MVLCTVQIGSCLIFFLSLFGAILLKVVTKIPSVFPLALTEWVELKVCSVPPTFPGIFLSGQTDYLTNSLDRLGPRENDIDFLYSQLYPVEYAFQFVRLILVLQPFLFSCFHGPSLTASPPD